MSKKRPIFLLILGLLLVSGLMIGCDSNRNELIRGFFFTATPIPPAPTETPIPTSAPTSIPTPMPEFRIEEADHAILIGDYDQAINIYQKALENESSEKGTAAASLGLARANYLNKDYEKCQNILIDALNQISDTTVEAPLWYQMAVCAHELDLLDEETNALREYLNLRPDSKLRSAVSLRIGDNLLSAGMVADARDAYISSCGDSTIPECAWTRMKIADTYRQEEDYTTALQTWFEIFDAVTSDTLKANINQVVAETYLELDNPEQAYARYQDAVNNYPKEYASYLSLLALLNAGQPVSEFQRGLINYYQKQYALSSEALYRYMNQDPNHDGSSWYYIGLNQMYLADYEKSIGSFATLIDQYPDNRFYASAWDEKSYVEWNYLENFSQGAQTLIDYVKKHPDQPDAPKFLFQAGRILERGDRLTDAANQWERLIDEYPLYQDSAEALFFSGLCRYRVKAYDSALATFNRLLLVSGKPQDNARAHFWIAKVYEMKGEAQSAKQNFELAANDSPTDYYTERAKELLAGQEPLEFSDNFSLENNLDQSKLIADQWMRMTFSIASDESLDQPDILTLDSDYQRANELWELGHFQEALNAFDNVRITVENDPLNSYRLLNRLIDLGAWRPAVFTSRQILTQAGLLEDARTLTAPNYFNQIRYGTWFNESVTEAYQKYDIHPFIFYALMRQESMYDPWIYSSAGAQGLMQIMPATGNDLAKRLNWPPGYSSQDLLRAKVAIQFAGQYLSSQYSYFGNHNFYMLAAYNGGPGNTTGWIGLAGKDPDLFIEVVRFSETRTYIKQVYEFAKMYERFYAIE